MSIKYFCMLNPNGGQSCTVNMQHIQMIPLSPSTDEGVTHSGLQNPTTSEMSVHGSPGET